MTPPPIPAVGASWECLAVSMVTTGSQGLPAVQTAVWHRVPVISSGDLVREDSHPRASRLVIPINTGGFTSQKLCADDILHQHNETFFPP